VLVRRGECVRADDDASDASATLVAKCRIRQRAWYIKSPWVLGHAEAKCWPYRELFGAVGLSGCGLVCGYGTWPGRKADERRELSAAREMWMPLEWSRLDGLPTTIG